MRRARLGEVALEYVAKLDAQLAGRTWLDEQRGGALAYGACMRQRARIAGENHDGNVARPRVTFHLGEQVPPGRASKRQLRHDDVRVQLTRPSKSLRAVRGGGDVEALGRQRD